MDLPRRRKGEDWKCLHCGEEVWDDYMLKNEIWLSICTDGKGLLHLKCVEIRLGRLLVADDFKNIAMNQSILYFLNRK